MKIKELRELIELISTLDENNEIKVIKSEDDCYNPERYATYDVGGYLGCNLKLLVQVKPYEN